MNPIPWNCCSWGARSYRAADLAGNQMILFDFESSDFLISFVILQVHVSAARACMKMQ